METNGSRVNMSTTSDTLTRDEKHNELAMDKASVKQMHTASQAEKRDETDTKTMELLGSVTIQNCPGTRTSARVIQKMKQDQTRPITPPPVERETKREEKNVQKTPSQVRTNKPSWSNLERNYFFDAVNEFGKDFDAIGIYINTKLKRKSATDVAFKTKDHVRQHYYQTYHKVCKYIKFSEEIRKPAQELYALINYGEMRRKLQFITDKHYMKLRNLVYQGYITVRCKGKNIRIKTPSCKALRRLNQLDDSLEDLRLPSKIEVVVSPANMEAFGRVQTIAQNPHVRTTVPLHKKLVNFIKTFQFKWRSSDVKLVESEAKTLGQTSDICTTNAPETLDSKLYKLNVHDPEMCFLPKPGVTIHRPLLSITEYLSSVNICLSAYEERIGVKMRSESLNFDRTFNKRQRSDSDSDKRSPDTKKLKVITGVSLERNDVVHVVSGEANESEASHSKSESSGDELNDEFAELLGDAENFVKEELQPVLETVLVKSEPNLSATLCAQTQTNNNQSLARTKRNTNGRIMRGASLTFKPLVSEDVIRHIRKGWTASNAADITIGDLYVVFGQDSRLDLNYYWTEFGGGRSTELAATKSEYPAGNSLLLESNGVIFGQKQNGMPYNPNECDDPHLLQNISKAGAVSSKLKHLLLIANLNDRIRKRQCSCGHTCGNATKTRIDRELASKTFISTKTYRAGISGEPNTLFRQPIAPIRRPIMNMDPVKQLNTLTRAKISRPVLVQRVLHPGALTNHSNDNKRDSIANTTVLQPFMDANKLHNCESAKTITINSPSPTNMKIPTVPTDFSNIVDDTIDHSHLSADNTTKSDIIALCGEETNLKVLHDINSVPVSAFDDISLSGSSLFSSLSPMHLLRESSSNSRWLEENLNDFSLTSLLGHLDEINAGRNDILDPSSNLSVISESSVDFRHKFQEITASMQNQDND